MEITLTHSHFLTILQLASPALPVGAYGYSEGLETLIENGTITNIENLEDWLKSELIYGSICLDAAIMMRGFHAVKSCDRSAASWQMGRSLMQLLGKLEPEILPVVNAVGYPGNYAIAFAIACAHWDINIQAALLAYLHSWANNLITAGIKLIPLGQTAGQELLLGLQPLLITTVGEILTMEDDDLGCCSWGLSLASMQHETQYTRLFRS
jgi:urease accessory protein